MGYRGLAVFKMAAVGRRLGFLKVRNFNGRVKMVNVRRCTKLREDRSSGCRFVQPWMTAWLVPWRLRLFHTVWCPPLRRLNPRAYGAQPPPTALCTFKLTLKSPGHVCYVSFNNKVSAGLSEQYVIAACDGMAAIEQRHTHYYCGVISEVVIEFDCIRQMAPQHC